jgi:bifunctional UDP-N-acetylglucosamine pyrophosphorylase / glucosamine-1-phosphate N-acetyltransferase
VRGSLKSLPCAARTATGDAPVEEPVTEMSDLHVVILAAGKGTRMKSALPKVLHRVAGCPMIRYVLQTAASLSPTTTTVVVGHLAGEVQAALAGHPGLRYVRQVPQAGTAHALLQTKGVLGGMQGTLIVLSGDVPLLSPETLARLTDTHVRSGAAATITTAVLDEPRGYGRIIRSLGEITRIVEERDATPEERAGLEINAGVYAFQLGPLFPSLSRIAAENTQGEYYLTDLVSLYRRSSLPLATMQVVAAEEIRGVNSCKELAEVSKLFWQRRNEALMAAGVFIEDPATTFVGPEVKVGPDTVIHPCVFLEGSTEIGASCDISSGVRIADSVLGDHVTVLNFCVITHARVAAGARVGPFAHLRPETDVREGAHIGNFVELKKTVLGAGSKANHHAYLGDATIGEGVNVGAGTITCNYDGEKKNPTVIEDGAFIGSDTQLIAPVRIGRGAYVAAGSSITKDVPPGALGIARGVQTNKEGWVEARRRKSGK